MTESLIAYISLVLCAMALSWILLYRAIVRRLNVRHPKKYSAMRGAAETQKTASIGCFHFCDICAWRTS